MVIFGDVYGNDLDMSLAVQAAEIDTVHALVEASLGLEHLAASFVSDASHFFDGCQRRKIWPRLESLTLTSKYLTSQQKPIRINDLLEKVALVAMKMPRLKSLELWNGRAGSAGLFQYQMLESDRTAKITWRGTWDLPLESRVLKRWQAVVSKWVDCKLQVLQRFWTAISLFKLMAMLSVT